MDYKRLFIPNSLLFITVVTKYRRPILVENISFLRKAFRAAKMLSPFQIVAIVVNRDHFHMIIQPADIRNYPKIIANIKRLFTKLSPVPYKLNNQGEANIWQRRFWEHTIQNEEDLYKHIDYIHYNPMKHYGIAPKDWTYSSFHQFVKKGYYEIDWCNAENIHAIDKMDLE